MISKIAKNNFVMFHMQLALEKVSFRHPVGVKREQVFVICCLAECVGQCFSLKPSS